MGEHRVYGVQICTRCHIWQSRDALRDTCCQWQGEINTPSLNVTNLLAARYIGFDIERCHAQLGGIHRLR